MAIVAVGYALRVADRDLDEARVPLLGVLAAFVFAAQMLNFPVAGGTSGHFLGATLAAVLLGPWLACLVMAVVIADPGVRVRRRRHQRARRQHREHGRARRAARRVRRRRPGCACCRDRARRYLGLVGGRLVGRGDGSARRPRASSSRVSGTVPLGTALPAMLGVHALIGVGEAAITVVAVSAVLATRPGPDRRRALRAARAAPARAGRRGAGAAS